MATDFVAMQAMNIHIVSGVTPSLVQFWPISGLSNTVTRGIVYLEQHAIGLDRTRDKSDPADRLAVAISPVWMMTVLPVYWQELSKIMTKSLSHWF